MIPMNNITTTTIRDTVSISKDGGLQVDEFDINFNPNIKTIYYDEYSVGNVENYPSIVMFIKNTLSNFELLNESETINFIVENIGLIELIEKATHIMKNHFPSNNLALEFDKDPEIPSFNKLVIYVKGNDESFDENWEEIKIINKEIRNLSLYDDTVKKLLSVDLW